MMLLVSTFETSQEVLNGKLVGLSIVKHREIWVTRGHVRKGLLWELRSYLSYCLLAVCHTS